MNMHASITEELHTWHDFYLLVGTASATLVGLMFVAMSIGAQIFSESNRAAMGAFLSSTVVHFSATLFICILATIPSHRWLTLAAVLALGGLAGLAYSTRLLVQLFVRHSFRVDVIDRMFYAGIPVLGHLLVLAAAASLLAVPSEYGLDLLAAALVTLLLAGIRNAWDMMIWIVIKTPIPGPPP
jgi:hypothetical protein